MKIKNYPQDQAVDPDDLLMGTDKSSGQTYNFSVQSVADGALPKQATNKTGTATFLNPVGTWVGTPSVPITGTITLDETGALDGYTAAVYFVGTEVLFTGGVVVLQSGILVENELCIVWIIYNAQNNAFIVNIQNGATGVIPPPDPSDETAPVIIVTDPLLPVETAPVITVT